MASATSLESGQKDVDVVIIGAGLSGLTAAHQLIKKDSKLSFVVLEAKDRVGGRSYAEQMRCTSGKGTWDLGGQWVGSCQPHVMGLIEELGLEVYRQYSQGRKILQLSCGSISSYMSDIPSLSLFALIDLHLFMMKINRMWPLVPIENPSECVNARKWDCITLEQFKRQHLWTNAARDVLDAAGRTIFGAEPRDVSLLYFLSYCNAAGGFDAIIGNKQNSGQEFKIKGGAYQMSTMLRDGLGRDNVLLNQPVHSICQVYLVNSSGQGLEVSDEPVKVKMEISPPLPSEKQYVLQRMPVGCLIKLIITYKTAFWREAGYSGEIVTSKGPLCVAFDATSASGDPAIVSFIGGQHQIEYQKLTAEERREAVLNSLQELFGDKQAQHPIDYVEKDWNLEPYGGGCPVNVGLPGVMTNVNAGLRLPVDRLHFAGTESATVWCGFLNGAVQSGMRAANEVMYHLCPSCLTPGDLEDTAHSGRSHAIKRRKKAPIRHKVARWTLGLGTVCILVVVAKKAYFRIAI